MHMPKLLLWINNAYKDLAIGEIKYYLSPRSIQEYLFGNQSLLLITIDESAISLIHNLALTKKASIIINELSKTYRIEPFPYSKELINKTVSMFNTSFSPSSSNILDVVVLDELVFAERIFTNPNDWRYRLPHNSPGLFPATIHPLIARAMINLSGHKPVFDPFVGSAGLVIEALLTNRQAAGIDIDPLMIDRARARLSSLGLSAKLWVGNALTISKQEIFSLSGLNDFVVVTEPPFGKNTKNTDLLTLYDGFLSHLHELTSKAVITAPQWINIEDLINSNDWNICFSFDQRIHKSLTRRIFLINECFKQR